MVQMEPFIIVKTQFKRVSLSTEMMLPDMDLPLSILLEICFTGVETEEKFFSTNQSIHMMSLNKTTVIKASSPSKLLTMLTPCRPTESVHTPTSATTPSTLKTVPKIQINPVFK
jgi:hypothetical protein